MGGTDNPKLRQGACPEGKATHNTALVTALLLAFLALGAVLALRPRKHPAPPPPGALSTPAVDIRTSSVPRLTLTRPEATPAPAPTAAAPSGPRPPQDLMSELAELSSLGGPLTKEQAEKFKQDLAELVKQGPASVPAIRAFLEKDIELDYAQLSGGDQLGYSSFRATLFDTLKQIGGSEAQATMLQTLQTTALPTEMLELAKNLDQEAPGVYRDQILNAAREALAMDAAGQLGTNREVGPAFRMLEAFASPNTVAEVAKTDPVNFYNALNLASLPDGQGLSSLVQMAQTCAGSAQIAATEMIAQLAGQNSQALETLVQMAQKGQISNSAWMRMAPILGGDQYQIDSPSNQSASGTAGSGNLNYSVVNNASTPDEINQRIALLDRCLGCVPADSSAARALQQQRDQLLAKLNHQGSGQ